MKTFVVAAAVLIAAASPASAQSNGGAAASFFGGGGFGRTASPPCVPVLFRNPDGRVVGGCRHELAWRRNVEVLPAKLRHTRAGWRWQ